LLKLIEQADNGTLDGSLVLLNLIEDEIYNVRAALAWTAKHDVQATLLLFTALFKWSVQRGSYADAEGLIDEVLNLPGASAHTIPRVKILLSVAHRGVSLGTKRRQAYAQEALALSRELGYPKGEANAIHVLGIVASGLGDWNAARNYLEASLPRYQTLGDLLESAGVLAGLSEFAVATGDFSQARVLAEQSLAAARHGGFNYPWPYGILANLALGEGDMDSARALMEQVLAAARPGRRYSTLLYALTSLGDIATRQGDFVAAHAFLDEAFVLLDKIGDPDERSSYYWQLAALAQAEGNYGDALRLYRASFAGLQRYPAERSFCLVHLTKLRQPPA
jgi:tetratricopeptide (TPR) repeat protein